MKLSVILIAVLFTIVYSSISASTIIDATVAIVNNEIVLLSELQEQIYIESIYRGFTHLSPSDYDKFAEEVLNEMIDMILLRQKAKEENIFISKEEVTNYLSSHFEYFKSNFAMEDDYKRYLEEIGMNEYQLKEEMRKQIEGDILIRKYLSMKALPKIDIKESEIKDYYEKNKDRLREPIKMSVSGILLYKLPPEEKLKDIISKMEKIRNMALSGEDFGKLAMTYSEFDDAKSGGLIDFFSMGTYLPEFEEVAFSLDVGEISEAFYTPYGVELVRVEAKKGDQISVRHIVLKIALTREETEHLKKNAEFIISQLKQNLPIENIIENVPYKGFKMEPVKVDNANVDDIEKVYPTLSSELKHMDVGSVSNPIGISEGFIILRLDNTSGGKELTIDEARELIKNNITESRMEEEKERLVKKLREKSFIRVMLKEVG
ncbi:MAG: peptidylprolyl isomerase [bacterium]